VNRKKREREREKKRATKRAAIASPTLTSIDLS
jgi:hypothetical protein